MKILIAPDSFKESLSAAAAAGAIAAGVRKALPGVEVDLCPIADGGEGTTEALVAATHGSLRPLTVTGPLGNPVKALWGILGDGRTGVMEMAQAAGLALVESGRRDPSLTTTHGVGQMIRAILDEGLCKIIVGIGGSATNDGGAGMAQSLGVRFQGLTGHATGGNLEDIQSVDLTGLDGRLFRTQILVACDVTNPLCGPEGASAIYGPQKGARPGQIPYLDAGLHHLADFFEDVDPDRPGMGAAGGLGFGLVAFCGARLARGIELVLDAVGFSARLRGVDLVITGEGRLDSQSLRGKACLGVADAAARAGVPAVALAGSLGPGSEQALRNGLAGYHALTDDGVSFQRAMHEAPHLLEELAQRVVGRYLPGKP